MRIALALALALGLGACFIKPDPPSNAFFDAGGDSSDAPVADGLPTTSDASVDASPDAPTPINCISYEFNSGTGCGGWGTLAAGAASIGNGVLTLTVAGSGNAGAARCTSPLRSIARATLAVASVPDLKTHRVALFAEVMGQRTGMELYESGSEMSVAVTCKGVLDATVIASGVEWFRIVDTGTGIVMQLSGNGTAWVTVGSPCSVSLSSAVFGLELTRPSAGVQASAGFESLELCP